MDECSTCGMVMGAHLDGCPYGEEREVNLTKYYSRSFQCMLCEFPCGDQLYEATAQLVIWIEDNALRQNRNLKGVVCKDCVDNMQKGTIARHDRAGRPFIASFEAVVD